jgi:hypothetical protein
LHNGSGGTTHRSCREAPTPFTGTYAQYVRAPAADLAIKPATLHHNHATALSSVGLTAWQALVGITRIQPGQRVLIHAAAGGVGHIAVQIAKAFGAHVIGTARTANHGLLRDLGADALVDYTLDDFATAVCDVDIVLDNFGYAYGPRVPRHLGARRPPGEHDLGPPRRDRRGRRPDRSALRHGQGHSISARPREAWQARRARADPGACGGRPSTARRRDWTPDERDRPGQRQTRPRTLRAW